MPLKITEFRDDSYIVEGWEDIAQGIEYDYEKLDYEELEKIFLGDEESGMQYGAVYAPAITGLWAALEIAHLPTAIVVDQKSGKTDEDKTAFANRFLLEQHMRLFEAAETKSKFGDAYIVFNLDRNLEAVHPLMCDPGFSPFNNEIINAKIIQNKYLRSTEGRKIKTALVRTYDAETIEYKIETQSKAKGVDLPTSISLPNPIGVCPMLHVANLKTAGKKFGLSDFYNCIPYFIMFHRTIKRGFEAQQYSGKPILVVEGIEGPVQQWLQQTFGIDTSADLNSQAKTVLNFFKRHKMFFFAGNVTSKFIEAKEITGRTAEILSYCRAMISIGSAIPEFMFGASLQKETAAVREQYINIKARLDAKQVQMEEVYRTLIKWAFVWYTTITKNEITGEPEETYGLMSTLEEAKQYKIDLIWPEFLGSEVRERIEAGTLLANAGSISRLGLLKLFPSYVPNPEAELEVLKSEMKEFGPLEASPDSQGSKNADERRRKDKSTSDDGDDKERQQGRKKE